MAKASFLRPSGVRPPFFFTGAWTFAGAAPLFFLHFAQRAFCAARIRAIPAADIPVLFVLVDADGDEVLVIDAGAAP